MRTKLACGLAIVAVCGIPALATTVWDYGWEDGGTVLGQFPLPPDPNALSYSNSTEQAHSDAASLKLIRGAGTATPQAYVAWVRGLQAGDTVTGSFWVYDTTPSGNPSGRIWGHYNDSPTDPLGFNGSASGNSTYSGTYAWTQLSYTWTIASPHTGLIIECRVYGLEGQAVWVDDVEVSAPDTATVTFAPEPTSLALLGLGLAGLIRRR